MLGTTGGWLKYFRDNIVAEMQPGDELWLYDTGSESWANLTGERGLAHIRCGRVIELIMEAMN